MTKTAMSSDLLETLQVLPQLVVEEIGHHLVGLAVLAILLSVQEPVGDLVLPGILHDSDDLLYILLAKLSSPLGEGDVGVHHTQDVLEGWRHNQRHYVCSSISCRSESSN